MRFAHWMLVAGGAVALAGCGPSPEGRWTGDDVTGCGDTELSITESGDNYRAVFTLPADVQGLGCTDVDFDGTFIEFGDDRYEFDLQVGDGFTGPDLEGSCTQIDDDILSCDEDTLGNNTFRRIGD